MAELRIPEPSEKQCLFMADRHKYIGYGGARGGGKSWAVRTKAKLWTAAEQHMETIGNEPERVKAYFRDPRVKYAA